MTTQLMPDSPTSPASELVALQCPSCGGAVPISDHDSVACPACGTSVHVPDAHRQAVRLVRAQDHELARAGQEWAHYAKQTVPHWIPTLFSLVPAGVLATGLVGALALELGWLSSSWSPRAFLGAIGLAPLAPSVALVTFAFWWSTDEKGVRLTRLSLAARPGKVPSCRNCGAALAVPDGALFVRCAYCQTDSLVTIDALEARALTENVERAEASANAALQSAEQRRSKAKNGAKWMAVIWSGMVALLLAWAFLPVPDLLVVLFAVDMLVLSMLTFMIALGTLTAAVERHGHKPGSWTGVLGLLAFGAALGASVLVWTL